MTIEEKLALFFAAPFLVGGAASIIFGILRVRSWSDFVSMLDLEGKHRP